MKPPSRPRKRQRTVRPSSDSHSPEWTDAISSLVERLDTIHSRFVTVRDDHLRCIANIEEQIEVHETASRVAAKVSTRPAVDELSPRIHSPDSESALDLSKHESRIPSSPLALLLESEPPEKALREQSIIARAQAINRKNSELARERLPKQPEPMRNKTLHDYFLDEAAWLATDFIGERKWKIQMARKIAKMVVQYHNQRRRREARAQIEEQQRIRKLATSIARDVSKFWRQIGEIAEYRASLKTKAEEDKERRSKLRDLLQKTEAFSSELASTLHFHHTANEISDTRNVVKQVTFGERRASDRDVVEADDSPLRGRGHRGRSVSLHASATDRVASSEPNSNGTMSDSELSSSMSVCAEGHTEAFDDETTMAMAEAEEEKDPNEISVLQSQAGLPLKDLLRSQGIDPEKYFTYKKLSIPSERSDENSDVSEQLSWEDSVDDEETIRAAEIVDAPDVFEGQRLAEEAAAGIEEILRAQGIDPDVYRADQTNYLKPRNDAVASMPPNPESVKVLPVSSLENITQVRERSGDQTTPEQNATVSSATLSSKATDLQGAKKSVPVENYGSTNGDSTKTQCESICSQPDCRSNTISNSLGTDTNGAGEKKLTEGEDQPEGDPHPKMNGKPRAVETRENPYTRLPKELLRGNLRDYQRRGLDWLLTLWRKNLNGILADEMGLGKTIQTIALLAWLAVEKEIWGPHLVVVPTSVMVNWEVEFKKWLPGFKVLTYFGSVKERKEKRRGWTRPDMFHVCITSYTLAVQDSLILRRKKWYYLILDEAHNIKNFESQRWQTLLTFSSRHRLLLTGTPLQNSVMELWSLMHFLMPKLFESHSWFKDTFWKPLIEAVEAEKESNRGRSETVSTLHGVLRPFLLRRLKADVEKGLPPKTEHVISCRLSKRQRQLYEDFMARNDTRETLQSGDFFGVMNVLMQLRKVCNHPDLFEGRPIQSPYSCSAVFYPVPTIVARAIDPDARYDVTLRLLGLDFQYGETNSAGKWYEDEITRISAVKAMRGGLGEEENLESISDNPAFVPSGPGGHRALSRKVAFRRAALHHQVLVHALRIRQRALLGQDLRRVFTMTTSSLSRMLRANACTQTFSVTPRLCLVHSVEEMIERANPIAHRFVCCVTRAKAPCVELRFCGDDMMRLRERDQFNRFSRKSSGLRALFREFEVRSQVTIPDTRLVQWDCGKLQTLERLIRELRARKSRALIFTQMTRMLDILESFLNLHCCRYLRLDGTTKTNDRQKVVERFNTDVRIFCMILTTRAGGVGLNLTGADTVIFYDTDYNPAIDNQAQDRAHRIGQTKPVHIYRLISEQTVEESILKRAMEKRTLAQQVISQAGFTTDAIRKGRGMLKVDDSATKRSSAEEVHRSGNIAKPGTIKNGFRNSTEPSPERKQSHTPENGRKVSVSDKSERELLEDGVQSSYGKFRGFGAGDVVEALPLRGRHKEESLDCDKDKDFDEYQNIASKLLAREDEREEMALQVAEKERRDMEAEFGEAPDEHQVVSSRRDDVHLKDSEDLTQLLDTLSPIQRYALRVLERLDNANPFETVDYAVPPTASSQEKRSTFGSSSREQEQNVDSESTVEDDTETLLYEIDVTDEGQISYLKALTDADADINLYLPLRDGGPEELKFSTVVHGTAAAGLECAEDAAFFPHAYNRMSRTMYATRRQKEKGLENLRKRKAEIEVKRKHEVSSSVSNQASSPKVYSTDTYREESKRSVQVERVKVSKGKSDVSRHSVPHVLSKKTRVDSTPKSRRNVVVTNPGSGPDSHSTSMGLFGNKPKKNARRFTIPGMKSSIAFYGGNVPSEHQGVNDEWTKEEDEALIAGASTCNNNMFFVADLLSSQAKVRVGVRRYRPIRHCVDRFLNVLGKDVKNGPLFPKSNEQEVDTLRKYQTAFQNAMVVLRTKPPVSVSNRQTSPEMHSSHKKLISEAASKMKGTIRPEVLPPISQILNLFVVPEHHKAGFKSHETARHGHSKRKPFMFAPRDELRRGGGFAGANNGSSQDQNGSGWKGTEQPRSTEIGSLPKPGSKGPRTPTTGAPHRPGVQNRPPGPSRNSSTPKLKTIDVNRSQAGSNRGQQAGNLPPPYNAPPRNASGSLSPSLTAYNQSQHVGNAQKVPSASPKNVNDRVSTSQHPSTKHSGASSSMQTGTKFPNVGSSPNVGKLPPRMGQASNAGPRKPSAAIVQSMGSASIPQKGDNILYSIGSHGVLSSNIGKVLAHPGDRRDRPKMVHTYMSPGMALSRDAGTNSNSIRNSATTSKTTVGRGNAVKSNVSAATGRGTVADHAKRAIHANGNSGLVRGILRGGIAKTVSRGAPMGRTATLGSAPRFVMTPNIASSGRGNTALRGGFIRGSVLVRGRGVTRGSALPRDDAGPKVVAAQRGGIARGSVPPRGRGTTAGLGTTRAISMGRRGMSSGSVGVTAAKASRGAATSGVLRRDGVSQGVVVSSARADGPRPLTESGATGATAGVSMGGMRDGRSGSAPSVSVNSSKVENAIADASGD
eukprot:TRINITY_DN275_c0_g1_i1.p1 TRINITY_DN275_c0_g1~~TRINITY_DN275_c0_g1_i1.p1  ORF type:complete len:2497 (+),score=320.07 TRINITY_DN275_c0_g1_i1:4775-12265(+)